MKNLKEMRLEAKEKLFKYLYEHSRQNGNLPPDLIVGELSMVVRDLIIELRDIQHNEINIEYYDEIKSNCAYLNKVGGGNGPRKA